MIPRLLDIISLFTDEMACLNFLVENNILYRFENCDSCGGSLKLSGKIYRCTKKDCRKKISVFNHSFFNQSKLKCHEILFIGYLWLSGCTHSTILQITGHSSRTIVNYTNYYRQPVSSSLDTDDCVIGGPGIIVEVDESKFGKRKYNRGHRVEGVWVLGGVERTERRLMFTEVVHDRSAETLLDVLSRHICDGSIVYTDLWRGYSNLDQQLSVEHATVNHSMNFVDPNTGVHTNTIEGTWGGIKMKIAPRNRTAESIDGYLLETIWRRKHQDNLWSGLIAALREIDWS